MARKKTTEKSEEAPEKTEAKTTKKAKQPKMIPITFNTFFIN